MRTWGCYVCHVTVEAEEMPRGWGHSVASAVNLCPEHFKAHIYEAIKHSERNIAWLREKLAEAEARPAAPDPPEPCRCVYPDKCFCPVEAKRPKPPALHDAMLDGFE